MRRASLLLLLGLGIGLLGWVVFGERASDPVRELPDGVAQDAGDPVDEVPLRGVDAPSEATAEEARAADADTVAGAGQAARITGEVLDERGRPIDGADVRVVPVDPASLRGAPYADGAPLAKARSDRNGDFELEEIPAGRWLRVIAARDGHATVGRLVPSAGAHVVLVLPPAGALVLTVVDTDDDAVAEARVQVATGETRLEARTDAQGVARFEALPPGSAIARVLMEARGSARAGPYRVRAGETAEHTVVVARGVALEGTVVDATAETPVANARIRVATPGRAVEAVTDIQGRFAPVAAGGAGERVVVAVEAEGYAPILEHVMLPAEGTQTVVLRLQPAEPWRGRVLDARGAPVPGATVRYSADGIALPMRGGSTTSDEQGRFALPPPPPPAPGRRVVLVARAGGALGALALRPDQLPPRPLDLRLATGTLVSGRVVDALGERRAGLTVRIAPAWNEVERTPEPTDAFSRLHAFNAVGNQGLAAATDADGRWRIAGVPEGPYRLWLRQGAHERIGGETLAVAGERVDAGTLVLDDGLRVTGEVVDERGVGIGGVEITVRAGGSTYDRRSTHTATDGTFEVPWLDEGTVEIAAALAGRTLRHPPVQLAREADTHVRLQLPDAARLRLQVRAHDAPYRGLLTVVFGESGSGRAASRRFTSRVRGGELVLDDVPVGEWTIEAFAPNGLRAQAREVWVEAGREVTARLDLAAGARLTGTVRTTSGDGVPGAALELEHPATGGRARTTADASGRFVFENLAAGAYTLSVLGRGGAPLREQLVLGAGEARALDPTLPPAGRLEVRVLDASGAAVPEALLSFRTEAGTLRTARPARTDADGRRLQADVPLGRVIVLARDKHGRRGAGEAYVEATRTAAVVVRLEAPQR